MIMRRHNQRSRRFRGAAYVEALIMLPVFIATWWGYYYLGNAYHARNRAAADARFVAWNDAKGAADSCGDPEPNCPDCSESGRNGESAERDVIGEANQNQEGQNFGWIMEVIGPLFGPTTIGSDVESYEAGSRSGNVGATLGVLCVARRRTLPGLLKEVVCGLPGVGQLLEFLTFCRD